MTIPPPPPSRNIPLGPVPRWLLGLLLGIATYAVAFLLRFQEWPSWQDVEYRLGNEMLLATHDAYHWVAGAEGFGFGEERLKRFHDAFNAKYAEIRELEKRDTKDNEYAIAKQEAALKAACGKYYSPREVRYDIKIVTRDGKQHKL